MESMFRQLCCRSNCANKTRLILVNSERQLEAFRSNQINTCKYNFFTFLPFFLLEQFRRLSNVFFLFIVILQQLPDINPTGRYTTVVPLMFILSVPAVQAIFEDVKRRRTDHKVNNYEVDVFKNGVWIRTLWQCLRVGEIVRVWNGQSFPADLVLLSSSEPYGMAYIETSNLDGETNLKNRQAHVSTSHLSSLDSLRLFTARIECEVPNKHLNEFNGKLIVCSDEVHSLTLSQILLRGGKLKNTRWIYAVVIYTGHDSKLLMNAKAAPLKRSNIDSLTNKRLAIFFVALIVLALISAGNFEIYNTYFLKKATYITPSISNNFIYNALTFFILYSNLIPISLQVTLELVRFVQAMYINNDIEIYDEATDTPANARTSNLNEELGQVKFLMSDKTGTLTKNVMKFKRCAVGGMSYGDDESEEFSDITLVDNLKNNHPTALQIYDLLLAMSVCHTVVPETDDNGENIDYQASSPDENALVRGAASQGFVFYKRTPEFLSVFADRKRIKLRLLNVLEFNSSRKRMSVLLRFPDNSIRLYCKGADNMILQRLSGDTNAAEIQMYQKYLQRFAENGYRTLCFSMRTIAEDEYNRWHNLYHKASISLENRESLLADAAEQIEKDLSLIGVTAIEDKLQDFVPETIQALLAAKIRIWILTGDKLETAINIAQSSGLCSKSTQLLILDQVDCKTVLTKLKDLNDVAQNFRTEDVEFALVISGEAMEETVHGQARQLFLSIAWFCRAVICCRMTPIQKAEVVEMIQSYEDDVVLAVGDGANDVAMIQAANVGVGITGAEGMQAASASDYSIGQFHFLRRLLLVHGTWNFERSVKVILYSYYKNICFCMVELWFAFFSAFSGQTIFDKWAIAMFNVIFTAWPPVVIGLFERPVREHTMMTNPALYPVFQNRTFSNARFVIWIAVSIWHSLSIFFFSYFLIGTNIITANGKDGGWLILGNSIYTYTVVTVSLKALLECDSWTVLVLISSLGSILLWFIFMIAYSRIIWPFFAIGSDFSDMASILMSSPVFWLGLVFIPTTTLLIDFVLKALQATFWPSSHEATKAAKVHSSLKSSK